MPETAATMIMGLDADGIREGKSLAALHPREARYVKGPELVRRIEAGKCGLYMIFVGHDDSFVKERFQVSDALGKLKTMGTALPIIVLACCSGSQASFSGNPFAEVIATIAGTKVWTTTRYLAFDEVGRSKAFTRVAMLDTLVPTNPNPPETLWVPFMPPSSNSEAELSNMLSTLHV